MDIRPLRPGDVAACNDVFFAAEDDLYDRRGLPHLPRNPGSLERLFEHIIGTNEDRAWVADVAGRVVAFGMATQRDRFWFLSFLFVHPEFQARGVGRSLLERCLPAGGTADVLGTCVEAIQPVSTALYARYGMVPRLPIYTLVGTPRDPLPRLDPDLVLTPFDELAGQDHRRLAEDVDRLDRAVFGFTRSEDHRAWRVWDRQGFMLTRDGETLGYGYAQAAGRVGPVAVVEASLLLPLVGELISRVRPIEAWQLLVPGTADATMVALLRAGLRFDGPPALFCATEPGPDLARALPGSFAFL